MTIRDISSFDEVEDFKNNSLIICDIDDTLLSYPTLNKEWITKRFNNHYLDTYNELLARTRTQNDYLKIAQTTRPVLNDPQGFRGMIEKVRDTSSRLIFLTARSVDAVYFTIYQLEEFGINTNEFPVKCCGYMDKGEYIITALKRDVDKSTEIIFIDDLDYNIENVRKYLRDNVRCYRFVRQEEKKIEEKRMGSILNKPIQRGVISSIIFRGRK